MPLQLDEKERANLERLEKSRMKPTRRQKANALLRLAAGLSPAEAAVYAGIPTEEVEALAAEFARNGLVGVGLDARPKTRVRLIRLGVGIQKYDLPKGATLADLLQQSQVTTRNQDVYLDGVRAERTAPLSDGAVVVIVPQPESAVVVEPWRATISSFRDEAIFQQYTENLKSRRADLGPDESPET